MQFECSGRNEGTVAAIMAAGFQNVKYVRML